MQQSIWAGKTATLCAAATLAALALVPLKAYSAAANTQAATGQTSPSRGEKPTPAFKTEELASDLRAPWAIAFLPGPGNRAWVTEREGRVREIRDGKLLPDPVLTVPDIKSWTKMGLLGLVLDPEFATNHFAYLAENYEAETKNYLRVVRYREEGGKLVEPKKLIGEIPAWLNHTGGRLNFGPDGKLYITTGDADKPPLAQDLKSLAGKILRINGDGSVPTDNPFAGRDDARPEIWSYGHRNSQGICWQPGTGVMFEAEHGPDGGDEVNIIRKGENYGWPVIDHDREKAGMNSPLLQYTPSIGPAEAAIYDGAMFPALKGDLLVGMMRGEGILRVQLDGSTVAHVERLLFKEWGRIREVAVAPDGAIWFTTSEFDPPEGRKKEGYDKVIRLAPAAGGGAGHAEAMPEFVKAVGAEAIYAQSCRGCHGDGRGSLNSSLFDGKWIYGSADADLTRMIHDGKVERGMPRYAERLTDAEISDLVAYIRKREAAAK